MRDFRIFFYKVGNGHCSYVEFPNKENGLIDVKVSYEDNHDNLVKRLKAANIINIIWPPPANVNLQPEYMRMGLE